jgi:hypothetical protein
MSNKKKTNETPVLTPTELIENPPGAEPQEPQPPWFARKAEDWELEDKQLPWQQYRCRNCNGETWSRLPEKHDLCEDCGYLLRREMAELEVGQIRGRGGRLLNPFAGMPIPVKTR